MLMENKTKIQDDLMDDLKVPDVHEVFFQFDNDEPVKFAYVAGDDPETTQFSLTLKPTSLNEPSIVFTDGKGKEFKLFMKKDGV